MTPHFDYALSRIVANCWPSVVGPEVGAVTLVSAFADGILTVLTPSAAWVEKLEPRTAELCDRLNHALLAPNAITSIQWCEGVPRPKRETA